MWIEQRGRQHRVYWRKSEGGKAYEPFGSHADAEAFQAAAAIVGTDQALALLALNPAALPTQQAPEARPAGEAVVSLRRAHESYWSQNGDVTDRTRADADKRFEHHIEPFFGDADVRSIRKVASLDGQSGQGADERPLSTTAWITWLQTQPLRNNVGQPREGTTLSPKTIKNLHGDLHALFEHVLDSELPGMRRNPCDRVDLPEIQRGEMAFLEVGQVRALADAIHPFFRTLIIFLYATGVRWGEAAGLLVKNVHLDPPDGRPYVHIRLAWRRSESGGMHLGRVKSKSSQRRITLSPRAAEVLRTQIAGKGPNDPVFTMRGGGKLHHSNFTNRFLIPAVEKCAGAGVDQRSRAHTLRHSHASVLISAGRPLQTVARRLGHQDSQVTERTYSHLLVEVDEDDLAVLDEALSDLVELEVPEVDVCAVVAPEAFTDDAYDKALPEIDIDDEDDIAA